MVKCLIRGGVNLSRSRHFVVIGDSMRPALTHRQRVQTWPASDCGRGLRRGDIVAFRHPLYPQRIYIKRVVGLPREHIAVEDDRILVDGQPQPELHQSPRSRPGREYARQWFTDAREYFLLGDNRGDSEDSRAFGPVASRLVIGRVWLRYWPPRVWPPGP